MTKFSLVVLARATACPEVMQSYINPHATEYQNKKMHNTKVGFDTKLS
jgi:hypothetical protein